MSKVKTPIKDAKIGLNHNKVVSKVKARIKDARIALNHNKATAR